MLRKDDLVEASKLTARNSAVNMTPTQPIINKIPAPPSAGKSLESVPSTLKDRDRPCPVYLIIIYRCVNIYHNNYMSA